MEQGLNSTTVDSDNDGLNNSQERQNPRLDPFDNDTDNDGVLDGDELSLGTLPDEADTDGDGVPDGEELDAGTSPTSSDTDGDGLRDDVELENPRLSATHADTDGDGLTDAEEQKHGTNPSQQDTDQDGRGDALEVRSETSATTADTDGDGLLDGVEAPPNTETAFNPLKADTDGDGLQDDVEKRIGTNPARSDTDGDGRSDLAEYQTDGVSPTEQDVTVIDGSPTAGLANASLQEDALDAVEFLDGLPQNRTERDAAVTRAATRICDAHTTVVSNTTENVSEVGGETYRNTYRVAHTAEVMQGLGADINPSVIRQRMQTARTFSGVAAKYTPVMGSYQRLYAASCAVKAGEPGAKQDFYIASAEFVVDLALAKENVMYKAAFKSTGYVAQKTGMMRLARVCGYKCVGMVESELHWVLRGTYSGALDQVAVEATDGTLTTDGWNQSMRTDVGEYLENTTNTTRVGGKLVPNTKIEKCVTENIGVGSLWKLSSDLSSDAVAALRTIVTEHRLPDNVDFSFVENVESVNTCVQN